MVCILWDRRFRIWAAVYKGRIDFSSFASRVSKLSSIANQVNEKLYSKQLYSYMSFAWRFGAFSVGFAPATEDSHCKEGHTFHVHIHTSSISAVSSSILLLYLFRGDPERMSFVYHYLYLYLRTVKIRLGLVFMNSASRKRPHFPEWSRFRS